MVNFQMQLTRKVDALPLTRDYIHSREIIMEQSKITRLAGGD